MGKHPFPKQNCPGNILWGILLQIYRELLVAWKFVISSVNFHGQLFVCEYISHLFKTTTKVSVNHLKTYSFLH